MSWVDGYLQASFRDVPFFIREASTKKSRRNVKHIYPRRDVVEHEDLGQDDTDFMLQAYLIGDDYYDQRAALEEALDQGGPGELVHPYRGIIPVVVNSYTISERTEEGRMCRFAGINFSLEGEEALTIVAPNTRRQIRDAKKSFIDALLGKFEDVYDLAQKPITAIKDVRESIDKAFELIDSAKRIANTQAEFRRELSNLQGDVIALSLNAEYLSNSMMDLINFGSDPATLTLGVTSDNARDQNREQKQIGEFTDTTVVNTPVSISRDDEYPSRQVQKLIGHAALSVRIGLMADIPFETVSEANDLRDEVFKDIDNMMRDTYTDDNMYEALRVAKRAIQVDIESRVVSLPRLIDFDNPAPRTTLSLVHEIYGNLDNEQDFINRNSIYHPAFVPVRIVQIKVEK